MRFVCEQCKAKYQIPDEKIAGRTVRMKCRKCGHTIEVRPEIAETSVAAKNPVPPRPHNEPSRATKLGALAERPEPSSVFSHPDGGQAKHDALSGAFQASVHRDDLASSLDLRAYGSSPDWYVAINGVPVGPIRIAELKRKAGAGTVTEDSLAWQEGLEEWRPIRAIPELSEAVREAAGTGRTSLIHPAADDEHTVMVAHDQIPGAPKPRAAPDPFGPKPVVSPMPPAAAHALYGGSSPYGSVPPPPMPMATRDPFAGDDGRPKGPMPVAAPPPPAAQHEAAVAVSGLLPDTHQGALVSPPPRKRSIPWAALALLMGATGFGITAALVTFLPKPGNDPRALPLPPSAAQTALSSGGTQAGGPAGSSTSGEQAAGATASPSSRPGATPGTPTGAATGPIALGTITTPPATGTAGAAGATDAGGGGLDLSSLKGTRPKPGVDDPGGGERPAGACYTAGEISSVVNGRRPGISRQCWERSSSNATSMTTSVNMTIGGGGEVAAVSAVGGDASLSRCVENAVRSWRFAARGCTQQVQFSYTFVRQ